MLIEVAAKEYLVDIEVRKIHAKDNTELSQ